MQFQTAANVDGWFLPTDVYTIYANGKQNDVPMLIGSNSDEGTMFTPPTVTLQSFHDSGRAAIRKGCRGVSEGVSGQLE